MAETAAAGFRPVEVEVEIEVDGDVAGAPYTDDSLTLAVLLEK